MNSRIVQVRGFSCDWHEVALRRRHRGDPQGDGAWELQHDQGVPHNNWAWLINILQCIVTLFCFKKKTVLSHQSCRFSLRHWTSTHIGVSQSQCSVSVSGAHFSKRKPPGGWCGRASLGEHWKGFSSVPFFIEFGEEKKVLFCSVLFFIEFPKYKIYSGCRSSGPLLPRSGSLVQLGKKSLQWVSDGEHASKNTYTESVLLIFAILTKAH